MNDYQSSVRRNESGVTSNAHVDADHQRSVARLKMRSMMRHTARPTQSFAGFGPNDSEKLPGDPLVDGPNPRTISNVIAGGTDSQANNGGTNDPVFSDWLYVFGQFVDHDLGLEATPLTNAQLSIQVPQVPGDSFAGSTIAMTRATRNPATNTIINTSAGYLDLSQLYGSDAAAAASLANADGTLKTSYHGL